MKLAFFLFVHWPSCLQKLPALHDDVLGCSRCQGIKEAGEQTLQVNQKPLQS